MAAGEYTTLALVKADLGLTDVNATRDAIIQTKVDAANARINEYIGMWIGPSADTSRTYDTPRGSRTNVGFRRLLIPGGIRTVTLVESASATGGTFSTVSGSNYFLRPLASTLPSGSAYSELWISDTTASSGGYSGFNTYRVTGTFGPSAVPASLVEIATTLAKRMYISRQSGEGDVVGTTDVGTAIFSRFLSIDDRGTLDRWRDAVTPMPGF